MPRPRNQHPPPVLETTCPSCQHPFSIAPNMLYLARGWVKCSHCQHAFNANKLLRRPTDGGDPATPSEPGTADAVFPAKVATAKPSSSLVRTAPIHLAAPAIAPSSADRYWPVAGQGVGIDLITDEVPLNLSRYSAASPAQGSSDAEEASDALNLDTSALPPPYAAPQTGGAAPEGREHLGHVPMTDDGAASEYATFNAESLALPSVVSSYPIPKAFDALPDMHEAIAIPDPSKDTPSEAATSHPVEADGSAPTPLPQPPATHVADDRSARSPWDAVIHGRALAEETAMAPLEELAIPLTGTDEAPPASAALAVSVDNDDALSRLKPPEERPSHVESAEASPFDDFARSLQSFAMDGKMRLRAIDPASDAEDMTETADDTPLPASSLAVVADGDAVPVPPVTDGESAASALMPVPDAPPPVSRDNVPEPWAVAASAVVAATALPGIAAKPEVPEFMRDANSTPQENSPWRVATALLALLIVIELTILGRHILATHVPASAPALRAVCAVLGCEIRALRQIHMISIENADLIGEQGAGDRYHLDLLLRNRSATAAALPSVEVTLNSLDDQVIARKTWTPLEYLPAAQRRLMSSGISALSELSLQLEFETPLPATRYRVLIYYP